MTIQQVLYVLAVQEYGSISKAAEHLFISQPALSLQIGKLEHELGFLLFIRKAQGIALTPEGQVFCESASIVGQSWKDLEQKMNTISGNIGKRVRIGIGARVFSNGLFDAVMAFFESRSETSVTYISDLGEHVLAALEEGRMDLALDRLPSDDSSWRRENFATCELLRERQCILLSPQDRRACLPELSFQSLSGQVFICGPERSLDDQVMQQSCKEFGVSFERIHRADNLEAMMALIRVGKGVTLGPRSLADRYEVAAVPVLPTTFIALNLISTCKNQNTPLFRQLKTYLRQVCRRRGETT